jgi:hypothetical protein
MVFKDDVIDLGFYLDIQVFIKVQIIFVYKGLRHVFWSWHPGGFLIFTELDDVFVKLG